MEIKHYPLHANTDVICEHYGNANTSVHYVCTTHPRANTDSFVADIFTSRHLILILVITTLAYIPIVKTLTSVMQMK